MDQVYIFFIFSQVSVPYFQIWFYLSGRISKGASQLVVRRYMYGKREPQCAIQRVICAHHTFTTDEMNTELIAHIKRVLEVGGANHKLNSLIQPLLLYNGHCIR